MFSKTYTAVEVRQLLGPKLIPGLRADWHLDICAQPACLSSVPDGLDGFGFCIEHHTKTSWKAFCGLQDLVADLDQQKRQKQEEDKVKVTFEDATVHTQSCKKSTFKTNTTTEEDDSLTFESSLHIREVLGRYNLADYLPEQWWPGVCADRNCGTHVAADLSDSGWCNEHQHENEALPLQLVLKKLVILKKMGKDLRSTMQQTGQYLVSVTDTSLHSETDNRPSPESPLRLHHEIIFQSPGSPEVSCDVLSHSADQSKADAAAVESIAADTQLSEDRFHSSNPGHLKRVDNHTDVQLCPADMEHNTPKTSSKKRSIEETTGHDWNSAQQNRPIKKARMSTSSGSSTQTTSSTNSRRSFESSTSFSDADPADQEAIRKAIEEMDKPNTRSRNHEPVVNSRRQSRAAILQEYRQSRAARRAQRCE